MKLKTFNPILPGHQNTPQDAKDFAIGYDFSQEEEPQAQEIAHVNFIDKIQEVEIYYCYGTDDYLFSIEY